MSNNKPDYLNLSNYRRVLKFAKKPTMSDFMTVAMITAAGIFIVGSIGFIIFVLMRFLPGGV